MPSHKGFYELERRLSTIVDRSQISGEDWHTLVMGDWSLLLEEDNACLLKDRLATMPMYARENALWAVWYEYACDECGLFLDCCECHAY